MKLNEFYTANDVVDAFAGLPCRLGQGRGGQAQTAEHQTGQESKLHDISSSMGRRGRARTGARRQRRCRLNHPT